MHGELIIGIWTLLTDNVHDNIIMEHNSLCSHLSYFLTVFNEIKGEYEAIIGFGSYEYVIIKSVYNINEP